MNVNLTWGEMNLGADVGVHRYIEICRNARGGGAPGDGGWGPHIDGAIAELAVAKFLNRYWTPLDDDFFNLPGDVGSVQVRATRHRTGKLIIYKDGDLHSTAIWVLAIVDPVAATVRIAGFTDNAGSATWDESLPRPAWTITQDRLLPAEQLPARIFWPGKAAA